MNADESKTEGGSRAWDLVEPIWSTISIYEGPERFLEQFSAVDPVIGNLFAVYWCYAEVCNGGLDQFFGNSTGVLAPEARDGFRAMGMDECAEVVEEAMRFFGAAYPRDRHRRIAMLDRLRNESPGARSPFDALDDRFYACCDGPAGDLSAAADRYARQTGSEDIRSGGSIDGTSGTTQNQGPAGDDAS